MGYIRHHAIVVTGQTAKVETAHEAALAAGCSATPIGPTRVNDTASFLVVPDGSKEGWTDSDRGNQARDEFITWLRSDVGGYLDWAEVILGPDDSEAKIARHAWDEA